MTLKEKSFIFLFKSRNENILEDRIINRLVRIVDEYSYESDGSKVGNWFEKLVIDYYDPFRAEEFYKIFSDEMWTTSRSFRIINCGIDKRENEKKVREYKDMGYVTYHILEDYSFYDFIVCKREVIPELTKIIEAVKILNDDHNWIDFYEI